MKYPVIYDVASDGINVSFPDIPEALTCSGTMEEAVVMAKDALHTSFEFYFNSERLVPEPSIGSKDFVQVEPNMLVNIQRHNSAVALAKSIKQE